SGEESHGLLRPRRHRRELPSRRCHGAGLNTRPSSPPGRGAEDGHPTERACISFLEMLLEKIHGALPGRFGARFVEAAALIAMETVSRAGIDVDLGVPAPLVLDYFDIGHRD